LALILISAAVCSIPRQLPLFDWITKIVFNADFLFWLMVTRFPKAVLASTGLKSDLQVQLSPKDYNDLLAVVNTLLPISLRQEGMKNDLKQFIGTNIVFPLEKLTVPTFMLHAKDDPLAPFSLAEEAARLIPNAKIITVERGGYFAMILKRQELSERIVAFIREKG
jgi:pimeloyl-ACP methyl ester carboxylesterase